MFFYPSLRPWAETQEQAVKTISPSNYSPEKERVPVSLTAGSCRSPRRVVSQGSGALDNICGIRQGEDTERGVNSTCPPSPFVLLEPLLHLGLCFLKGLQKLCRRNQQILGCQAEAGDRLSEAQGNPLALHSPHPRGTQLPARHTSQPAAAQHPRRAALADTGIAAEGRCLPTARCLPTQGTHGGVAPFTWGCCFTAGFWWQEHNCVSI